MSKDNFDVETKQLIAEGEALGAMFESSGWKVAERELMQIIADLQSVSTLDMASADIAQQVRDRINTVAALQQWLGDLHGRVNNVIMLQAEPDRNSLITRR
jgi:hypothetical protein